MRRLGDWHFPECGARGLTFCAPLGSLFVPLGYFGVPLGIKKEPLSHCPECNVWAMFPCELKKTHLCYFLLNCQTTVGETLP